MVRRLVALVSFLTACSKASGDPMPAVTVALSASPPAVPPLAVAADASADPGSCGALECRLFDSAADAVAVVLAEKPRVVAFGESHAPKGKETIPSAAKRFAKELLPLFQGKATDLLVELVDPPSGCRDAGAAVAKATEPVISQHADTSQNEYVVMGRTARALGMTADLLHPTCAEMEVVARAGDLGIVAMLELIEAVSERQAKAILARPGRDPDAMLLVYGGAHHGDPDPPARRAAWSFGPALSKEVSGRYLSVHVFVPEYVGDDDTWRQFAWYARFDKAAHPTKVTRYRTGPQQLVVLYASTPKR